MLLALVAAALAADVESPASSVPSAVTADADAAATPRLAYVEAANFTDAWQPAQTKGLTRAEQTVAANEWWCAHSDKVEGLSCRRHLLQQRHRQAVVPAEREAARRELNALLEGAGEAALAALRDETNKMLSGFCALATNRRLEVCVANRVRTKQRQKQQQKRPRPRKTSKKSHEEYDGKNPHAKRAAPAAAPVRRAQPPAKKRGIAKLWTTDNLAILRAWWCADQRHAREPRCARGVRWTRQQPGLTAMRRLFCVMREGGGASGEKADASAKKSKATKLCLGPPPAGVGGRAVYEGSSVGADYGNEMPDELRSGGGIAGYGASRRQRPTYLVRPATVVKLMLALLVLALFIGWKARTYCVGAPVGKRAADAAGAAAAGGAAARAPGTPAGTAAVGVADEEAGGVVSASAARRRVCLPSKQRVRPLRAV